MSEVYSHRNGETEPPTIDNEWFWFDGDAEGGYGVVIVIGGTAIDTFGAKRLLSELEGRWWGPVTPPWEQE